MTTVKWTIPKLQTHKYPKFDITIQELAISQPNNRE